MATKHHLDCEDLGSEFDPSEKSGKGSSWKDDPLAHRNPVPAAHSSSLPSKQVLVDERDKEEWRLRKFHLLSMDAYSRHKTLINQYLLTSGKSIKQFTRPTDKDKNDFDILKEQHRFLWDDSDVPDTWEKKLAKTYYDKLFKEYTISDLSRYKENKVALRWRTEAEVISGKGQFVCGSKHCISREDLRSWEVNFSYEENGERKNALVKLRLCPSCSKKLNYHHKKKRWKGKKRTEKKRFKKDKRHRHKTKHKKRGYHSSSSDSDSEISQSSKKGKCINYTNKKHYNLNCQLEISKSHSKPLW